MPESGSIRMERAAGGGAGVGLAVGFAAVVVSAGARVATAFGAAAAQPARTPRLSTARHARAGWLTWPVWVAPIPFERTMRGEASQVVGAANRGKRSNRAGCRASDGLGCARAAGVLE